MNPSRKLLHDPSAFSGEFPQLFRRNYLETTIRGNYVNNVCYYIVKTLLPNECIVTIQDNVHYNKVGIICYLYVFLWVGILHTFENFISTTYIISFSTSSNLKNMWLLMKKENNILYILFDKFFNFVEYYKFRYYTFES